MAAVYVDARLMSREGGAGAVADLNRVSANYFDVLGVQPIMGRNFAAADEQPGHHVAILSYGFWQRVFGGDAHAVGQTILISDEPYTVIGVMPQGLAEPRDETAQVWSNIAFLLEGSVPRAKTRDSPVAEVIGRLKPGVTQEQAQADLSTIQAALAQSYREIHDQNAVGVHSELEDVAGSIQTPLYLLLAAVMAVLLIVCTNVAGLMLTRAMRRSGETALRMALGASQWRVWRQMLMEALVPGVCGGLMGALLAWGLLRVAPPLIPEDIPRIGEVGLSWRVLCFTAAISLLCVLLSSVAPAWKLTRVAPITALREQGKQTTAGRRTQWFQNTLVVVQTMLGVALLLGSGFLIRGFVNTRNVKTGFRTDHLFSFNLPLTEVRYPHPTRALFYRELIPKLAAIPGVQSASGGYPLPLQDAHASATVEIDGRPNAPGYEQSTLVGVAEPGFFETLGVPLMRGRLFTAADDDKNAPPVAVVNQAFVKRYFPNEDPVGRVIRPDIRELRNQAKDIDPAADELRQIVGVVADTRQDSLIDPPEPMTVFPFAQASELMRPRLVMRVAGDPMRYEKAAANVVQGIDPTITLLAPWSGEMQLNMMTGTQRFETWLITGFSAIALFLAGLGLYSMLATMVTTRTREIGVRMAIGAARSDVARLILARATVLLVAGLAAGSAIAAVALRVVNTSDWAHELLFGVSWGDPRMIVPMAAVFGVVALSGCLMPTWRATRIDPSRALRDE
jgi:putative ABC transport system permease protein